MLIRRMRGNDLNCVCVCGGCRLTRMGSWTQKSDINVKGKIYCVFELSSECCDHDVTLFSVTLAEAEGDIEA